MIYFLSLAFEDLPVSGVYGTWAAIDIVAIAAIGVVTFDESVDIAGVVGLALIDDIAVIGYHDPRTE